MPIHVVDVWSGLENPFQKPYRPHIKSVGDEWVQLSNYFTKDLLDIASTSAGELDLKIQIANEMKGESVWAWLESFRRAKEIN